MPISRDGLADGPPTHHPERMTACSPIALEHEPEKRCEHQQQREDGEEAPIRDLNTERVGTVVEIFLITGTGIAKAGERCYQSSGRPSHPEIDALGLLQLLE